jgi:hypothetical protein
VSLNAKALQTALVGHAKQLKLGRVIPHDPKNPPGTGLTVAVFAESLSARPATGLNRSAGLVVWIVRVMVPINSKDAAALDRVETDVLDAVDRIVGSFMGAFTLGGLVRCVDIRGMAGTALRADFGYVELGGTVYRFAEITTPLIVNDVWTEVP